jgi:hypothetical protein
MSEFLNETVSDIRGGRDSWRVLVLFSLPAFVISFAVAIV